VPCNKETDTASRIHPLCKISPPGTLISQIYLLDFILALSLPPAPPASPPPFPGISYYSRFASRNCYGRMHYAVDSSSALPSPPTLSPPPPHLPPHPSLEADIRCTVVRWHSRRYRRRKCGYMRTQRSTSSLPPAITRMETRESGSANDQVVTALAVFSHCLCKRASEKSLPPAERSARCSIRSERNPAEL